MPGAVVDVGRFYAVIPDDKKTEWKREIVAALKKHDGNAHKAAAELGIVYSTLRRRIAGFLRIGIDIRKIAGTPAIVGWRAGTKRSPEDAARRAQRAAERKQREEEAAAAKQAKKRVSKKKV